MNTDFLRSIDMWSSKLTQFSFSTGIFPSEMAYLCSQLQAADIKLILDFGRGPDAYSSIVLNEYVNQNNEASYFSVDWDDFSDKEFF